MNISAERERELVVAVLEQKDRWKLVREVKPNAPLSNPKNYLRRIGEPLRTITISSYTFSFLLQKEIIKLEIKEGDNKEIYVLIQDS
jgi:hypothetical protein